MWQSTVASLHPSIFILPDVNSEVEEEALAGDVVGDPSMACRNLKFRMPPPYS